MVELFSCSAPGKVILFGEHGVVYGTNAIVSAISKRINAYFYKLSTNEVVLESEFMPKPFSFSISELDAVIGSLKTDLSSLWDVIDHKVLDEVLSNEVVARLLSGIVDNSVLLSCQVFLTLCLMLHLRFPLQFGFHVVLNSTLPLSSGLGSSGSFSTVIAASLLKLACIYDEQDPEPAYHLAMVGETICHGNPSGIDVIVSLLGTCLVFKKENSKVSHCPVPSLCLHQLNFIIVNTKITRNTRQVNRKVKEKQNTAPDEFNDIIQEIQTICNEAEELFQHCDTSDIYDSLKELIKRNQIALCRLGVSHPKIDQILMDVRGLELEGKLTGAGMGGCLLILTPISFNKNELEKILNSHHVEYFYAQLGEQGISFQS